MAQIVEVSNDVSSWNKNSDSHLVEGAALVNSAAGVFPNLEPPAAIANVGCLSYSPTD